MGKAVLLIGPVGLMGRGLFVEAAHANPTPLLLQYAFKFEAALVAVGLIVAFRSPVMAGKAVFLNGREHWRQKCGLTPA